MPDSQGRPANTSLRPARLAVLITALIAALCAASLARHGSIQSFSTRFRARLQATRAQQAALRFPTARASTSKASLIYANGAVQHLFPGSKRDSQPYEPIWEPASNIIRVELPPAGVLRYKSARNGERLLVAGNASLCETAAGACDNWTGVSFSTSIEAALNYLEKADPLSEALATVPARDGEPPQRSVTLVTQLSVSRLDRFDRLLQYWDGPVSATIYLVDEHDFATLANYLHSHSEQLRRVTLTILKPSYAAERASLLTRLRYPINRLRNLAIQAALSPYILVIDVDFVPSPHMYSLLVNRAVPLIDFADSRKDASPTLKRTAVVIPTFALANDYDDYTFPQTMEELEALYRADPPLATLTDPNSGHGPTRPNRLFHQRSPASPAVASVPAPNSVIDPADSYEVWYEPQWEPYYVLSRASHPLYDERFTDQGGDKQSHALVLNALGFRFVVMRDVWVVHPPKRDAVSEAWPAARLDRALSAELEASEAEQDFSVGGTETGPTSTEHDHFNLAAQRDDSRFRYFQDFLPEMERLWGAATVRWPRGCSAELLAQGRMFGRARPVSAFGL